MRRLSILLTAVATLLLGVPATASAAAPPLPAVMGAAGDSITRGFDATFFGCLLADCPQYSWSTGSSSLVNSQAQRIRTARGGAAVAVTNAARTGAKMGELGTQLAALPANVEYATVLMGANDVCTSSASTMTPVATFETQFRAALTAFVAAHAKARVFVSSIPNVAQLYNLLKGNSSATSAWRTFKICQSMLAATNTQAIRDAVTQHEIALNGVLARVCGVEFAATCRWDGNATFNYLFRTSDVSTVDYFHPSVGGQAQLARISWGASYWAA